MTAAEALLFERDGIWWSGQTIADSRGRILFGKGPNGELWMEIVTDTDGVTQSLKAMYPDGKAVAAYLADWFR